MGGDSKNKTSQRNRIQGNNVIYELTNAVK
jgi:hypothetical protein